MYGIAPDDRLWLVNHDHAERRQEATANRMAAASRRDAADPSTSKAATVATRHGSTLARLVRHVLGPTHRLAHHGAAR